MKHNGWRKPTPGLGMAEQLVQVGERASVPKSEALVACKRVGAHIGLKAADMMLLDTFGAFTQPQDWAQGRRPIVWASNALLMEQTGFSLSALKRHARRLIEAGVLGVKDSPNGKRWGHRDGQGHIIEAYGYDLSPLAARAEEFNDLFAQIQAERQLCARLKRQITVTRRAIRARLDYAAEAAIPGPWARILGAFERLLARLPKRPVGSTYLDDLLTRFTILKQRLEALVTQPDITEGRIDENTTEMDPKQAENDPHIPTTKELKSIDCNLAEEPTGQDQTQHTSLTLATIMQACPEFASWTRNMGGYVRDWGDLHRMAGQLLPMIGVSRDIWQQSVAQLGHERATAAMVLVFDKHCTGEVTSPGGYLRGMIAKAGAGALHLDRSFYGRLKAQA